MGREIARAGAVLLCGGRLGVMEAAARSASEAGGEYGTLCEIAIALKQRIPLVGLESWRIAALEREPLYAEAGTPAEAVRPACELASRGRGRSDPRDAAADG